MLGYPSRPSCPGSAVADDGERSSCSAPSPEPEYDCASYGCSPDEYAPIPECHVSYAIAADDAEVSELVPADPEATVAEVEALVVE